MRTGVVLPFLDAAAVAEMAAVAEQRGWDGVFVAESVWGIDAWVAVTAAAMRTSRIRLGTMLTPLARFRPSARPWRREHTDATTAVLLVLARAH